MLINQTVLMSGADYFGDDFAINPYMDAAVPVSVAGAVADHQAIAEALRTAGIQIVKVPPPADCQDGVYTANWGLVRGGTAVLSSLPNKRQAEEPYARAMLARLGKKVISPASMRGEQAKQAGAFGQAGEPRPVIVAEPAVEGTRPNTFEGKQQRQRDDLAGMELRLRVLGFVGHDAIDPNEQTNDKIVGGHANLQWWVT